MNKTLKTGKSKANWDAVVRDYVAVMPIRDIMKKHRISKPFIYYILSSRGIKRNRYDWYKESGDIRFEKDIDIQQFIRDYKRGYTYRLLQKKYDLSESSVTRYLRHYGLKRPKNLPKITSESILRRIEGRKKRFVSGRRK
jgi:Mor family transcriptional regulator